MRSQVRPNRRQERRPRPLDKARLEELALAYVARFATSAARFEAYLKRKLRERGWDDEGEPEIEGLVLRYVELGYIDDVTYARARAGGLLRRGYGQRRVDQALGAAGISAEIRADLRVNAGEERAAALAMAKKRRFGPFGLQAPDRARREKQIAALLRAGHPLDSARVLVDAANVQQAEAWVAAAIDDEGPQ